MSAIWGDDVVVSMVVPRPECASCPSWNRSELCTCRQRGGRTYGRTQHYRLLVAEFLLDGYEAKVQGGEEYIERVGLVSYDDGPYEAHFVKRTKQPGVVLRRGDETILIATTEREGAERLLADALVEVESIRG